MTTTRVARTTRETRVEIELAGASGITVPVPFFGHLLDACTTTWGVPVRVEASGDIAIDPHHLVEDTGTVLGSAIRAHWPGYQDVSRYGWAIVPMDEARAEVAVDLSGRAASWLRDMPMGPINGLEGEVLEEFWPALARGGQLTVHVEMRAGRNRHHQWEAAFKALGLALRMATSRRPGLLSTKGMLDVREEAPGQAPEEGREKARETAGWKEE